MNGVAADLRQVVERCRTASPYLRDGIARFPQIVETLGREGVARALAEAHRLGCASPDLSRRLRIERGGVSLALALADLAGLHGLEDTVACLTRFADRALDQAIAEAMRERTGAAAPTGFAAIALGKQGSCELNFSSDIDPIFLFDPRTLPTRPREDAQTAAVRIGRRVVELLQARTADGYVLRVDLRLRPSPEVFPIAVPVDAAIAYYESSALAWERAAFIRARAAAGDSGLGEMFLAAVQPFVWRRSLDFGAIADITAISRRIRDHDAGLGAGAEAFGPGYDLKRGHGGIREIEFYAQIHQLIHGGRDADLRAPATLDALARLGEAGRIDAGAAADLAAAYRMLRTIEHRLQMIEDRQTHRLPVSAPDLDAVARLHGAKSGDALLALLRPHVERVAALYDMLAGRAAHRPSLPPAGTALEAAFAGAAFANASAASRHVAAWRQGRARSLRSPPAREAFEGMLPSLIAALGRGPDPDGALNRFADIVERVPSGINLYRLIEARPALVGLLAQILGHAPALAQQLARRPELLDGLIDASILEPAPDVQTLADYLAPSHADEPFEHVLDGARRRINEWRFALGVQLVSGEADPLDVSAGYARVAEAAVTALADATVRAFVAAHGRVSGSELAIVALGRLGGRALTHASDLDLVYLFTGGIDASSDGDRPLRATDYYNRLARRVTAALSIPTAAGPLYDVDTRLRPSGVHGMLAVSLDAFTAYQRDEAWTFEHMALTRARTIYGSAEARAAVDAEIGTILTRPRDRSRLVADAAAMRADIARAKPGTGRFDVKLGDGGLVDLEFAVHVLQLATGRALHPNLGDAVDALIADGDLPGEIADHARLLARMLVTLRLVAPGGGEPDAPSRALVARACGLGDWASCVDALATARAAVGTLSRATLERG